MRIHLLHTNDVHSQLENYMRIGNLLRQTRNGLQSQGEPVLTFDIGDVIDRIRPETEATYGCINAALMAALDYDGWVFGNNEGLTIPTNRWRELVQTSHTTVYGTNIRSSNGTPLPYLQEWKIYDCHGVRVGVFGLTAHYDEPYERLDVQVIDPHRQAVAAVQTLREHDCQVVILLSHLGLREDRKLARAVQGIDVILGGHTHDFLVEAEYVNETAIYQCGKHALAFGHTIVDYDESALAVRSVVSKAVPLDVHTSFDIDMMSAYEHHLPGIKEQLNRPVLVLQEPLAVRYDRESTFGNLLADALIAAYPADIAIMMSGALTASLMAGRVRMRDVHAACLTPTRPLLITMRGMDIRMFLEKAIMPDYYNRMGYGYGFRGSVIGYMALANAQVQISASRADGQDTLKSVIINGCPLSDEHMYRVVSCEYLWLSPVFEEFHRGRDIDIRPALVREVLMDRMQDNQSLSRAREHRYVRVADASASSAETF